MIELDLAGGQVLGDAGLETRTLSLAGGRIVEASVGRRCDLTGYLLLPGIVDLHGDAFERHLAPRRGAMTEMAEGLRATDAELAANGITTAVLAQFMSWEGGLRSPEFAEKVFCALRDTRASLFTDMRGQLRLETHLTEVYPDLPDRLDAWGVEYVIFNDHLPHDRLAEGRRPPRLTGQALKAGRDPEAHFRFLLDLHARSDAVPAALDDLCERLQRQNVRLGSHDDATALAREVWYGRGATIAEFPETRVAAQAARAMGDRIVLGAPNVVRGGSHIGNVSARELVSEGLCDALASDYHYPSPRRAALHLATSGALDLATAWRLVSSGPAETLGLEDRGHLRPGLRADLVILDAKTHRVAATMVAGRFSHLSGDIAERLIAA